MNRRIAAALVGAGLGLWVGSGVAEAVRVAAGLRAPDDPPPPSWSYSFDLRDARILRTQRPSPVFCDTPTGNWVEAGIHEPCPQWEPQPVWSPDGLWEGGGCGWASGLHPDDRP